MLKNNEPRQARKDPFIYTESQPYSVLAGYARTHLQAVQCGCRDERTARGTSCSFVALHSIHARAHVQCMHVAHDHMFNAGMHTRPKSEMAVPIATFLSVNVAYVQSILHVINCLNIINCDCVDRSFWYKVDRIDNDGMITLNSRLLSLFG